MRASTRVGYAELVAYVRESLDKLGMGYLQNVGEEVTEFEVRSPVRLRVLATNRAGVEFGFLFRSGVKRETTLELLKDLESKDDDAALRQCASALVGEVVARCSRPPWEGFGAFGTRSEKARWLALKGFPTGEPAEREERVPPRETGHARPEPIRLEGKDYLALAIAALETVLLPLVVLIVVVLVLLAVLR